MEKAFVKLLWLFFPPIRFAAKMMVGIVAWKLARGSAAFWARGNLCGGRCLFVSGLFLSLQEWGSCTPVSWLHAGWSPCAPCAGWRGPGNRPRSVFLGQVVQELERSFSLLLLLGFSRSF